MIKKTLLISALSIAISAPVIADSFRKTDDAVDYRKSAFSLIAHNFGNMSAMLKGKKEMNAEEFEQRAANIAALSHLPMEGFIAGSYSGDTEALAKIEQNKSDFADKMEALKVASAKLAMVAKSGDKKAIKTAFGQTAKTCKSCHKAYKKD
ncbi:cytochrome C [Shewanella sp. OPT22]|nr:cytochrome C [Shewanella sp. OPT22]